MTTVHTAYGSGEVVESDTVRGRTRFRVAGDGFNVWLDECEVNRRTAGEHEWDPRLKRVPPQFENGGEGSGLHIVPGADMSEEEEGWNDFLPSGYSETTKHGPHHQPDYENAIDPDAYPEHFHEAAQSFDFEPSGHTFDNSTTLPYNPEPQFPVDMFRHEQTISPDHRIDVEDRLRSSDSRSLEEREDRVYPGPNPDLFAKEGAHGDWRHNPLIPYGADFDEEQGHFVPDPDAEPLAEGQRDPRRLKRDIWDAMEERAGTYRPAGLSDKYADVHDAADHYNDPVQRFRDDPHAAIQRHGYIDISAGLDAETGEWMDLVQADKQIRTAAWNDVRKKAMRLKREGAVHVKDMSQDHIYANVDGDNGRYEVMILKGSSYGGLKGHPTGQSIANWKCSCKWGQWAFKRQLTFVGRLCSHGYASYLTMQGERVKEPGHPFRKNWGRTSSTDSFKKWCDDENGGHIDLDAADNYLSTLEEPPSKEDAQKVLDYVQEHHSEHPEREYDQDGYSNDPEDAYKGSDLHTADVLRHQPGKLTPHLYVVPEGEESHFEDLGDDRETTGPTQIQAKGKKIREHHPDFAWHEDGEDDFPESGIVHFSARKLALIYTADEDLLNKLRDLSQDEPSEHFQDCQDHNREVSEVVEELHDRGFAAEPLVAMRRQALWRTAAPDDEDQNGSLVDKAFNAVEAPFGGQSPVDWAYNKAESGGKGVRDWLMAPPAANSPSEQAYHALSGEPTTPQHANPKGVVQPATPLAPNATPIPNVGKGPGVGGAGEQPGGGWTAAPAAQQGGLLPGSTYTVGAGDTMSGISERGGHGGDTSGFAKPPSGDMNLINPGGQVKMPGVGIPGAQQALNAVGHPTPAGATAGPTAPGAQPPAPPAAPVGPGKGWKAGAARRFAERYFFGAPKDDDPYQMQGLIDKEQGGGARLPVPAGDPKPGEAPVPGYTPPGGTKGVPGVNNGGFVGQPAAPAPAAGGDYTVNKGDTLSGIAGTHGGNMQAIIDANPGAMASGTNIKQNPNLIHPGDVLHMGPGAAPAAGGVTPPPAGVPAGDPKPGEAPAPGYTPPGGAAGVPGVNNGKFVGTAARFAAQYFGVETPGLGVPGLPTDKFKSGTEGKLHPAGHDFGLGDLTEGKTAALFARRYFGADDDPPVIGADDKNKGADYKQVSSPGSVNQPRPQPAAGTDVHNPLGAPAAGTVSVNGSQGAPMSQGQSPGQPQQHQQGGGSGGGPGGVDLSSVMGALGPLMGMLGGGGGGLGGGLGALTGLLGKIPGLHLGAAQYAARYMQGAGDFLGEGGGDWADQPFAGSGPARQNFSGTSQDYVDEHEKTNRRDTWVTDDDGDIIHYTKSRPQQKPKQSSLEFARRYFQADGDIAGSGNAGYAQPGVGKTFGGGAVQAPDLGAKGDTTTLPEPISAGGISMASRQFWADAVPGTGYFNPANNPGQDYDKGENGVGGDLPKKPGKGKGRFPGLPKLPGGAAAGGGAAEAGGAAAGAGEAAAGAGELAELAPLALAASRNDDQSDVVRRFHASGGGCLNSDNGGSQFDDAIAERAQGFLRTAGRKFTPAEERELEDEWHPKGARNLASLDLTGTHYLDDDE